MLAGASIVSGPLSYSRAALVVSLAAIGSGEVELAREVQRLSDQIEELREEERSEPRAQRTPPPAPSSTGYTLSVRTPVDATKFVMRDGSHVVAQNYAISGETVWIFDEHKARKIAIAQLDRAATDQINSANGVDLKLP